MTTPRIPPLPPPPPCGAGAGGGDSAHYSQSVARPPLPCGEGVGGEGRANARSSKRKSAVKLGHGWAPIEGQNRQKDRTRTKLRARRLRKEMTPAEKEFWTLLRSIEGHT